MLIGLAQSDQNLALQICEILEASGHEVIVFSSGSGLLQAVNDYEFDLLIVDAKVSDMSGLEVVKKIRGLHSLAMPLLLLISRVEEHYASEFFSVGVDDYCVKPVRRKQLLARVSAILKESTNHKSFNAKFSLFGYEFDVANQSVSLNGKNVCLSEREFSLAIFLFDNVERTLSRKRIVDALLNDEGDRHTLTNSLHLLVACLRSKLDLSATSPVLQIKSVYGYGYRLIVVD